MAFSSPDSRRRRVRRAVIGVVAVGVLAFGAAFAFFALRGGDAPAPPSLAPAPAGTPEAEQAEAPGGTRRWTPGQGSFVGYRVREEFARIGVVDAVGRTGEVTGSVTGTGERLTAAQLTADLGALQSDEPRRDNALRDRGIETARFPTARFELSDPVEVSRDASRARGQLTLHGVTRSVTAELSGQETAGGGLELVGSVPVRFARFDIEPPSVAGFVTVRDEGRLEVRLRLSPSGT